MKEYPVLSAKNISHTYESKDGQRIKAIEKIDLNVMEGEFVALIGTSGGGDSDIMMTDTINPLKSKFKGFHKTFKQDDLGLSLSSFLLN